MASTLVNGFTNWLNDPLKYLFIHSFDKHWPQGIFVKIKWNTVSEDSNPVPDTLKMKTFIKFLLRARQ